MDVNLWTDVDLKFRVHLGPYGNLSLTFVWGLMFTFDLMST